MGNVIRTRVSSQQHFRFPIGDLTGDLFTKLLKLKLILKLSKYLVYKK